MAQQSVSFEETPREVTFKDYADIVIKRKSVVISFFVMVSFMAALHNITRPNIYSATSQILIQDPSKAFKTAPELQQFSLSTGGLRSQIELMKSASVASAVIEKYDLMSKYPGILGTGLKGAAKAARGMVSINQIGESRVFDVVATSTNPNLCAELANGLVDEYIEKNIVTSFLSSPDMLKKMFPDGDGKTRADAIYGKLRGMSKDEVLQSLPYVVKNPKMAELKEKKSDISKDLALYSAKYTDKHPKVIKAKREIQAVKEEMQALSGNIVSEMKDSMSGRFDISNVKVIEYADVPASPIGPKRLKDFLLISIMAFFGACGVAIFIDYLDNTVKTQEDVEKYVRLPYLGYIPLVKDAPVKGKPVSISDYVVVNPKDRRSNLLESLRNVRTSITFSAPPDALKSILIASALPKEGKSTIALNLAIVVAGDGSRTLLVDGDMRRPSLHKMVGSHTAKGLSNYLTSKMAIEEAVVETRFENLYFMPCGPIPPNPSELFGSYRMKELLDEAGKKYDKIIFDGAPIFGISDSVVLAKALDGVIQITRFGKVTWDMANKCKQRLQNLGVKMIGVIINGVDTRKESYYYKYYDYRYHKYYE
ncbi:MAG: polysaccharide biosynthesis tyrosine autokinase [Candidatus Omnitrophota bacterium]